MRCDELRRVTHDHSGNLCGSNLGPSDEMSYLIFHSCAAACCSWWRSAVTVTQSLIELKVSSEGQVADVVVAKHVKCRIPQQAGV